MYDYKKERPRLNTFEGMAMAMDMHAAARRFIAIAGCVRVDKIMWGRLEDPWMQMAGIEYLVEVGKLMWIEGYEAPVWQHKILVEGNG